MPILAPYLQATAASLPAVRVRLFRAFQYREIQTPINIGVLPKTVAICTTDSTH